MAKLNVPKKSVKAPPHVTHAGGVAAKMTKLEELRRNVLSCMLWENAFYEKGDTQASRIAQLVGENETKDVVDIAIAARTRYNLRHVPLWIARCMLRFDKHRPHVAGLLATIIQRPDEISEFLSLYWKDGKTPLAAQVKKGLAKAFLKFGEYAVAKHDHNNAAIKLRDVLFLVHAKPDSNHVELLPKKVVAINRGKYNRGPVMRHSSGKGLLFSKIVNKTLAIPDTIEVALSSGANQKDTFVRLISENKIGALAMLRNLRKMQEAGVPEKVIREGLEKMNTERVLPFRFIAAARYGRTYEPQLEKAMFKNLVELNNSLVGKTAFVVDVSGSMDNSLSEDSDLTKLDAAKALAILLREVCADVDVYTFSDNLCAVPGRRGFALGEAIEKSQRHNGTNLRESVAEAFKEGVRKGSPYKRMVVITDEQASDGIPEIVQKGCEGYLINVASYQNGVGYGKWVHIDGFSEAVVDFVVEYEKGSNASY